jgi:hypothetical protein
MCASKGPSGYCFVNQFDWFKQSEWLGIHFAMSVTKLPILIVHVASTWTMIESISPLDISVIALEVQAT